MYTFPVWATLLTVATAVFSPARQLTAGDSWEPMCVTSPSTPEAWVVARNLTPSTGGDSDRNWVMYSGDLGASFSNPRYFCVGPGGNCTATGWQADAVRTHVMRYCLSA
jgi:hypothetical protein